MVHNPEAYASGLTTRRSNPENIECGSGDEPLINTNTGSDGGGRNSSNSDGNTGGSG